LPCRFVSVHPPSRNGLSASGTRIFDGLPSPGKERRPLDGGLLLGLQNTRRINERLARSRPPK
jgi:hypothetical protein